MTTLVHTVLTLRRTARAGYGFVAVAAFGLLDLLGAFRRQGTQLGVEHALVAVAWVAVFTLRVSARARQREAGDAPVTADLELALLLLVLAHAVVQIGGGLTGELYPLVYVLVAFVASFGRKPIGAVFVLVALGFEAALYFVTEGRVAVQPIAVHATFVTFFGLLNLLFTRAEIARARLRSRRALDEEKAKVREDARMFRLVAAPVAGGAQDQERLMRSSLQEVHDALFHLLDMLRKTLDLHTCVLLLRAEGLEKLGIVELSTCSDEIAAGPFSLGEGAVGAVAQRGQVTNLEHIKPGYGGLCYYRGPVIVRAFLGVPVVDDGELRGALCVDRIEDRPFTAREEDIIEGAVHQVLRTLENERVFVQLEKSKREQTILYAASQRLGAALSGDAVLEAGLTAAAEVASHDFAAITFYDEDNHRHTVRRAVGEGADAVVGLSFRDNTSLTAMAVKNRHYLPYRGEFDPRQQVVYTKRTNLRGMGSLLIMPLIVRERAIGTLALAARRRGAFNDAIRPTLLVLANHLAVSLANAEAVERLEEMATTDGLTGCLNKRAFLEALEQKLQSAERFDRKLSLLVTDIDHFKSVNDTYGHATGDVVLRELGEVLRRMKRETDVVARFGGEEFCVLCEETDAEGALLLAERIRQELAETLFQTEIGKLRVTCSIGVATFPTDAGSASQLFESSDRALYAAKNSGRNRVCVA